MGFTASVQILVAATICAMVALSSATHYVPLGDAKNSLRDSEFSFSFKKDAEVVTEKGIHAEFLSAKQHRLLPMPDVDVSFTRVYQEQGHVIPWHVHPRGTENYATIKGHLQVTITLEGFQRPRRVVSKLPPGHVAVIPQGIPHSATCLSKTPCEYLIFFNKADGGIAFFAPGNTTRVL